jgi:hypothetical protein
MKPFRCVIAALASVVAMPFVNAQVFTHPTLLKFKLLQDGEVLASPNLMVEQRIPAVFEIEGVVRLEVVTVSNDEAADMALRVLVLRDGVFTPVAAPRLLGLFDQQTTVELGAEAGRAIKIIVTPSKGERNETPKPLAN